MKTVDFGELEEKDIKSIEMRDEAFAEMMGMDLEGEEATNFACAAVNKSITARVEEDKPYPVLVKREGSVEIKPTDVDGTSTKEEEG